MKYVASDNKEYSVRVYHGQRHGCPPKLGIVIQYESGYVDASDAADFIECMSSFPVDLVAFCKRLVGSTDVLL